jgi:protein-S-isoprenylcysteine O-methyltransferase Ste14
LPAEVPYLIPILAGFLAGCSAILLRQAERALGDWLGWLSLAAAAASAGSFLAGFLWAASTPPVAAPSGAQILAGCLLALAGGVLVGWAVRARGLGVLRLWRADRFEQGLPYRAIRRPLELGVIVSTAGLCWLRPAPPVWVCLAVWITLWNAMLELGEWELRQRLPACREYLRRTPRYFPRLRAIRPGSATGMTGAG